MESLHSMTGKILSWVQASSSTRELELREATKTLARLKWERVLGTRASAITADGQWTFKRTGFVHPAISIRQADSEKETAIFKLDWTGTGNLFFDNGLKLSWVSENNPNSKWAFRDPKEVEVLHFQSRPEMLKLNVQITILKDIPETPLLACLGMYLLYLVQEEKAAVSASIAPAGSETSHDNL